MIRKKAQCSTPHDISSIVRVLNQDGISPLVWGEMGVLGAYRSRLVPMRLSLIIRNEAFDRACLVFSERLGLIRAAQKCVGDRVTFPLHRPYVRFAFGTNPADKANIQLFKASDVGLEDRAWEDARMAQLPRQRFLVPSPDDFLQIAAHLHRQLYRTRHLYERYEVSGALAWVQYLLSECFAGERLERPELLKVTEANADIAWLICKRLPRSLACLEERWGDEGPHVAKRNMHRRSVEDWISSRLSFI